MSYVAVVLLSLLWLGFFLPGLLQARRSSPLASASTFQESLTRISTGRPVDTARLSAARLHTRRELARQRDVLAVLTASALGSLVLGVAFGGWAWWLAAPALTALAGYVALLRAQAVRVRMRRRAPARAPAVPVARPAPLPDGVVPSVRRREAGHDLERIAG